MRNAACAEWLLARFTDKFRAASIVGDLEEASVRKGRAWFWKSVIEVMLTLSARPTAAFLLAALGGGFTAALIASAVYGSFEAHAPDIFQRAWVTSLAGALGPVWMISCYSLIRFGIRDTLARMLTAFSLIGTVAACFWWYTGVPEIASASAIALVATAMAFRAGRRGMAAAAILSLAQSVIWLGGVVLLLTSGATLALKLHIADSIPKSAVELFLLSTYLLLTCLSCVVCLRIHRLIFREVTSSAVPSQDQYPSGAVPGGLP